MKKRFRLVFIVSALLISLLPLTSASANSAMPPSEFWFKFDFQNDTTPSIESFTLVFCSDEECSYSVEVTQVPNSADMPYENALYCYDNWCKWGMYTPTNSGVRIDLPGFQGYPEKMFFKVNIRFSDGERTSNIFDGIPVRIGDEAHFKITVNDQALLLAADDAFSSPILATNAYPYYLTLLVEPILFALLALFWLKQKFRETLSSYGMALLANLISWPMVWSFFPSIALYHYKRDEIFGLVILLFGIVFSYLMIAPINGTKVDRASFRIMAILLLPVACYFSFGLTYGSTKTEIVNMGLPVPLAFALIEICAVLYEGTFVYFLSDKKIPWRRSMLLSLITNAASFGLGLVLL